MPAYFIVLILVLFILVGLLQFFAAQRRRRDLIRWCQIKKLRFSPGRNDTIADQFPDFECLHKGENQYAYNVMTGDWHGCPLLGFDYHYETHTSDQKGRRVTTHHHFSAMILSSKAPLKPLVVRPEGIFDKVSSFFGFEDIILSQSSSAASFSSKPRTNAGPSMSFTRA